VEPVVLCRPPSLLSRSPWRSASRGSSYLHFCIAPTCHSAECRPLLALTYKASTGPDVLSGGEGYAGPFFPMTVRYLTSRLSFRSSCVDPYLVYHYPIMDYRFHFEFDSANKILLARFEGQLTNEAAEEYHDALGKNWRETNPHAGIWDLSRVTNFVVASDFLRSLAKRKPITPGLTDHPRFVVVPAAAGYGLMRMFQIAGESERPLLHVVRTVDEALAALGAQSAHFEPLD
jgi:hypothetical protein